MPALAIPLYLPDDGDAVDAAFAHDIQVEALRALLVQDDAAFWESANDAALQLPPFLDSYLRHAPRSFALPSAQPDGASEPRAQAEASALRRLVLLVHLRLATTKPALGGPDWEARLAPYFDAPRLLDLCALYGLTDSQLCQRIVAPVLRARPDTSEALASTVAMVGLALSAASGYQGLDEAAVAAGSAGDGGGPTALGAHNVADLVQMSDWLLDVTGTLHGARMRPLGLGATRVGLGGSLGASARWTHGGGHFFRRRAPRVCRFAGPAAAAAA
jgi:hypothetical protein